MRLQERAEAASCSSEGSPGEARSPPSKSDTVIVEAAEVESHHAPMPANLTAAWGYNEIRIVVFALRIQDLSSLRVRYGHGLISHT